MTTSNNGTRFTLSFICGQRENNFLYLPAFTVATSIFVANAVNQIQVGRHKNENPENGYQ